MGLGWRLWEARGRGRGGVVGLGREADSGGVAGER